MGGPGCKKVSPSHRYCVVHLSHARLVAYQSQKDAIVTSQCNNISSAARRKHYLESIAFDQ